MSEALSLPQVVPGTAPRSTPREALEYGVGYALFAAGRLVRDLVVAGLLGPATFGVWGALSLYRQYANYSDFGFTNGLGRLLPRLLAADQYKQARQAMSAAWVMAVSGTALCTLATAFCLLVSGPWFGSIPWCFLIAVAALTFLDKQYMYSSVVFRSLSRVGESGMWMGCLGSLELVLGAVMTRQFGLCGLLLSVLVALLITNICMTIRQPLRGVLPGDISSLRHLVTPSLILMGLGLGTIAIHNVDRVAILYSRGSGAELGQYQVAATLSLVVSQLPYLMMTAVAPKLFRFDCETRAELRRYLLPLTALAAISAVSVALLAAIVLPDILRWALPKYFLAAGLVSVLMAAEVCFALAMVADSVLVAAGRGGISLLARALTIISGAAGSIWALSGGHGLTGVAYAMLAAQAAGIAVLGTVAARSVGIAVRRYWCVVAVPAIYAVFIFIAIGFGSVGLPLSARLALCAPALLPFTPIPLWFLGVPLQGVGRLVAYLEWREAA